MPKDINYYPGQTLGKEELQFKDYADKYMSMYVDLIRAGIKDVLFVKDAVDFEQSKGTGSPEDLNVAGGYCLFNKINSAMTDFDYKTTLNAANFIDQKFFVRSSAKTISTVVVAGSYPTKRYVYLSSYLVPAAFECTVGTDGTLTTSDGGSIKKSELTSILRGSSSNAPTRVRFINPNYTKTSIVNTGVYEINEVISGDTITLTESMSVETIGTVLCVPIGSFNLGTDNNLENRAMFCYTETNLSISEISDLDDADGIIKICELEYLDETSYNIIDLRQLNKYAITIDVDFDLSDYVTKSTTQTISAAKAFTNLVQGKMSVLTKSSNWQGSYIMLNNNTANDIIFDCESLYTIILGFKHTNKAWGTNPDINIVEGTVLRVMFINVAGGSIFGANFYQDSETETTIPIKEGVLYSIRAEKLDGVMYFSVSPTVTINDLRSLQLDVSINKADISSLNGRVSINESDISDLQSDVSDLQDNVVVGLEVYTSATVKIYVSSVKKGSNYLVTVTSYWNGVQSIGAALAGIIPVALRPISDVRYYLEISGDKQELIVKSNGDVDGENDIVGFPVFSVTYCTGLIAF